MATIKLSKTKKNYKLSDIVLEPLTASSKALEAAKANKPSANNAKSATTTVGQKPNSTVKQEQTTKEKSGSDKTAETVVRNNEIADTTLLLNPDDTSPFSANSDADNNKDEDKDTKVAPAPQEKQSTASTGGYEETDAGTKATLETNGLKKFCSDEGYITTDSSSVYGIVKANCKKDTKSEITFVCYKYKAVAIPKQAISKHFANYCFKKETNSVKFETANRPSTHSKGKKCPNVTPAWKKQNNANAGACDPQTGELYITECKADYVGTTRGISKDGYKSCNSTSNTTGNNDNELKKLCTKGGAGSWENDNCICKNTTHSFDSEKGCVQDNEKTEELKKKCTTPNTWNEKLKQCECENKKQKFDEKAGKCVDTDAETETNNNDGSEALCTKDGAGSWADGKCTCTDETHSFDSKKGCILDKKKAKAKKTEDLKNKCKAPNTWNEKLKKCKCENKKQEFDEEAGTCVDVAADYKNAVSKLEQLKQQLDTKLEELNKEDGENE